MRQTIRTAILLSAISALPVASVAQTKCDNTLFKGTYVLFVYGTIYNIPDYPVSGPVVRIGRAEAKGDGTFLVPSLASYAGVPAGLPTSADWELEPADGTVNIAADCSFTLTVSAPPPLSRPIGFSGNITADGSRLSFLQDSPPGSTVKATSLRLPAGSCGWDDFSGNWSVEMKGVLMPKAVLPLPPPIGNLPIGVPDKLAGDYSMVGSVNLTPPEGFGRVLPGFRGVAAGATLVSYKGVVNKENWTGNYVVNPDCTMRVHYIANTLEGPMRFSWWGMIKKDTKEVRFLMAELPYGPLTGEGHQR